MDMMTVKQISLLTGVSVRTLQFYDEIGLFKPTKITQAGYRLYDERALEELQKILFLKELHFTLKEIRTILHNPDFDLTAAFKKQRELIRTKRESFDALLKLLDQLIEREKMERQDFDMGEYFHILAGFKKTHAFEIVNQLGSMERFDEMISDLKAHENKLADQAVAQYGSIENFTKAMKSSLEKFLAHGSSVPQSEVQGLIERGETLTKQLTADLSKDPASFEVQESLRELIRFTNETNHGTDMGENYWPFLAEAYLSNPVYLEVNDKKYGEGASKFIGRAIQAYLDKE